MGISISIASGKGGTGKTVLTANLGVALSEIGKRVIILDADIEMANLALHLGLEGTNISLHTVLSGEADIRDAVYEGPSGVKVVPSGMSLDTLIKVDPDRLGEVLKELLKRVDILLIDAPAGLSKSAVVALASAQEVILVVNPEISSLSGALKTKIVAGRLGADILGVVVNRADISGGDLNTEEVEILLETKILGLVPEDPEVGRTAALGTPIVLKSPDSPAAVAVKKLASDLVQNGYLPESEDENFSERLTTDLLREN
ncbi:MAG: cell division ATPase MinD [Candidatus Hydrothermarchaeales archaeon]